jgi:hypothetical protein
MCVSLINWDKAGTLVEIKNQAMFGSGYENCPEFGVLGGVIFKLDIL